MKNVCSLSDFLKYNANTACACFSKIIPFWKVKRYYLISDGTPSQCKNYKNFINLYYHYYDHEILECCVKNIEGIIFLFVSSENLEQRSGKNSISWK